MATKRSQVRSHAAKVAPLLRTSTPAPATAPVDGGDDGTAALRALAEQLAHAADTYNRRLKAEAPTLDSGTVYARLQEEQRLRGMANQLYFEAADRTLAAALGKQSAVEAAVQQAIDGMASTDRYAAVLAIAGDLLALAAAILSRKPITVVAALEALQHDAVAVSTLAKPLR